MAAEARVTYQETGFMHRLFSDELLETVERWQGITAKPELENRRKRDGIRIFRNGTVEKLFSKAHPIMPIVYAAPFIALGLYRGLREGGTGVAGTAGLFALGILMWTLLEYVLHRWLFHWELKSFGGKMLSFMLHGYHHEFPDDRLRLVAPPLMLIVLGLGAGLLFYALFGADAWAQVFGGNFVGYVAYDWTHYHTHHAHPTSALGKWLRRYHLKHHFQHGESRFGISSPLWDFVFRTYRPADA